MDYYLAECLQQVKEGKGFGRFLLIFSSSIDTWVWSLSNDTIHYSIQVSESVTLTASGSFRLQVLAIFFRILEQVPLMLVSLYPCFFKCHKKSIMSLEYRDSFVESRKGMEPL